MDENVYRYPSYRVKGVKYIHSVSRRKAVDISPFADDDKRLETKQTIITIILRIRNFIYLKNTREITRQGEVEGVGSQVVLTLVRLLHTVQSHLIVAFQLDFPSTTKKPGMMFIGILFPTDRNQVRLDGVLLDTSD